MKLKFLFPNHIGTKPEILEELKNDNRKQMFRIKPIEADSNIITVSYNNGKRWKESDITCIRSSPIIS